MLVLSSITLFHQFSSYSLSSFFFLESIIVRLGVHNPMWHFYRLSRLYVLSLLINFDFTFNTSPRCWARLCDSEGVGRNGALVCAKGKWSDCDGDNI